ncbi:MAG: molybdopterin-dependent oxidoreductase [Anaerolineae bacterium]|nr:molybdopterin-dependent oxidoreductase [Anaerolineae bacterium]
MSQSPSSDYLTLPDSTSVPHQRTNRTYPSLQPAYWSFMLGGSVTIPLMLSYADLLAIPAVEIACAVACAGHQTSESAIWQGTPLSALLDEVDLNAGTNSAQVYAADGYRTSLDLAALKQAVLAYQLNGRTLEPEDGGPVRLILPNHYGYKMPKWIQRIMLAESSQANTWEQRSESSSGYIQPIAAILNPRHRARLTAPIEFSGTAFAGSRPITGVEIRVDEGPWMPAAVEQQSPHTLARWSIQWTPHVPGEHLIQARAADQTGFPPGDFPASALTAYAIVVHVEE